ncbi:MAG: GDP-L-fucose synthase [Alphaproteobacteria bacterium]|nr:GDP-L-fucose synthase [Alphaproteobacteria bacterium]MBU1525480.1 GDP-L-fucose synthase [Alphaproteobacteria bacterium]MBU2116308.1 GDP-L-fucose synthase [Alphaproteobacteria bacterium]MBU2350882.1 GDP-L-fucose synthase [Alphaproteobacteria bacterium]MBU2381737.1 GDP-L-fucose synthase [Alphaproteobacteria bacterium]
MEKTARIFVAGHNGMVGAALCRRLADKGYVNLVTRSRADLDLTDQSAVRRFFDEQELDYVFIAAAKVGGIHANNVYRAEFLHQNLMIAANLIDAAHVAGLDRLMFLGSSCIYPRDCPQPIREEYLLTGPLESTNEPYALAKIAGVKLCEAYNAQYGRRYVSVMPTNLYGPGDNYDLQTSHVLPALLRKAVEAKAAGAAELNLWGTGTPRREFLFVDDLADACVHLMERDYAGGLINVGTGEDVTIRELAELIMDVVGVDASLTFDASRPDGTPRKLLDVSQLAAQGWTAKTDLRTGIEQALAGGFSQFRSA